MYFYVIDLCHAYIYRRLGNFRVMCTCICRERFSGKIILLAEMHAKMFLTITVHRDLITCLQLSIFREKNFCVLGQSQKRFNREISQSIVVIVPGEGGGGAK